MACRYASNEDHHANSIQETHAQSAHVYHSTFNPGYIYTLIVQTAYTSKRLAVMTVLMPGGCVRK